MILAKGNGFDFQAENNSILQMNGFRILKAKIINDQH